MVDFNASPQLRAIKRLMDAYISLDINKVGLLISKDYQYQPLPEVTDPSKEAKRSRARKYKELLAVVGKFEVRI